MSKSSFLRLMLRTARRLIDPVQPAEDARAPLVAGGKRAAPGRVVEIQGFGSNPGALRMLVYAPSARPSGNGPLIVLLHGCGQDAAAFAAQTGWLALAERIGASVLLPEQQQANSRGRCFNWFKPSDARRGRGEALSILQMVNAAAKKFNADRSRIFIAGLSAGGAMTAALLAAYPGVFNAGAIIAGMPVGAAQNLPMAVLRMRQADPYKGRAALADAVYRSAPAHSHIVWPRVSIWHGGDDQVVDPANGVQLAQQWSAVHGFQEASSQTTEGLAPSQRHQTWGAPPQAAVELWQVADLGHGYPIDGQRGDGSAPGFAVIDVGVSATDHIARFWGIGDGPAARGQNYDAGRT